MRLFNRTRKPKTAADPKAHTEKPLNAPAATTPPPPPAPTPPDEPKLPRRRSHSDAHAQAPNACPLTSRRAHWSLAIRRCWTRASVIPVGAKAGDGASPTQTSPNAPARPHIPLPLDILALICDFLECDDNHESRAALGRIMLAGRWGYHVAARALYRTVVMNDGFAELLIDLQPVPTDMRCRACVHCGVKRSPDPSCLSAPIGKASLLAYTRKLVIGDIGLLVSKHAELWHLIDEGLGRATHVRSAMVGGSHSVWKESRPTLFPSVRAVNMTAEGYMALQDLHHMRGRGWDIVRHLDPHPFVRILVAVVSPTTLTFTLPTRSQVRSHVIPNRRALLAPTSWLDNKYKKLHTTTPWIAALIDAWPLERSA